MHFCIVLFVVIYLDYLFVCLSIDVCVCVVKFHTLYFGWYSQNLHFHNENCHSFAQIVVWKLPVLKRSGAMYVWTKKKKDLYISFSIIRKSHLPVCDFQCSQKTTPFVPIEFSVTLFVVIQLYCIFYDVLHRISMHLVRVDAWICSTWLYFCFCHIKRALLTVFLWTSHCGGDPHDYFYWALKEH